MKRLAPAGVWFWTGYVVTLVLLVVGVLFFNLFN